MKLTITIPKSRWGEPTVEEALDGLWEPAGGCTFHEASGLWVGPPGRTIAESVILFTVLLRDPHLLWVVNNVVDALHDLGEQVVLVELYNHGHSYKLLQKGDVYYNG